VSGKGQVVEGQGSIGGEGADRGEVRGGSEGKGQREEGVKRKGTVNIGRLYMAEW